MMYDTGVANVEMGMSEFWFAAAVFVSLATASLVTMYVSPVLPARHRDDDTNAVIRLMANIFVVMTSLVFSLMINSSKNTFETVNASAHSYATSLILLDHSLRTYGIAGRDARALLGSYAQESVRHPARANDVMEGAPDTAGRALDSLGDALMAISPQDAYHEGLIAGIRSQYQDIVRQRWAIIEQSEGVIPFPLVLLLLAWLILIFGSFGYRAPQNAVIIASMVISSGLVAAAFYLVLDMDLPFSGFIQVSDEPLRRALAQIKS